MTEDTVASSASLALPVEPLNNVVLEGETMFDSQSAFSSDKQSNIAPQGLPSLLPDRQPTFDDEAQEPPTKKQCGSGSAAESSEQGNSAAVAMAVADQAQASIGETPSNTMCDMMENELGIAIAAAGNDTATRTDISTEAKPEIKDDSQDVHVQRMAVLQEGIDQGVKA